MPTYEYMCIKCNHKFEDFSTISNRLIPETKPCPSCSQPGSVKLCVSLITQTSLMEAPRRKPAGFKEVQQKIAQYHPRHTMDI